MSIRITYMQKLQKMAYNNLSKLELAAVVHMNVNYDCYYDVICARYDGMSYAYVDYYKELLVSSNDFEYKARLEKLLKINETWRLNKDIFYRRG